MTEQEVKKKELLKKLGKLQGNGDIERNHYVADRLLVDYIDDEEINEAYCEIKKWYA